MKKFFKALALVLALVLVIGAIPASAATTFTMKKDVKRVYLGGAQGKKADGTQCKTSSKYRISKLINGFDAATMYLKLESSDKTIVKTNNAKRKVYGKKIGSATVKISVYDKESDILLDGALSATIEVKKNADPTTVIPMVFGKDGELVDPTAKFALNTPYTVVISRKDAAGNLIDTDKRSFVCTSDNKADVEIAEANKYTTKYTVTFKKAGDYTFAISNYQSSTWDAPINTFPFDVTAGYVVNDVKQVALNKVRFTFDTEVSNLIPENFNTYYEVEDATGKISKVYPTAAQAVDIDTTDKTNAVVTFLSDFEGGKTYYFEYGDSIKREDVTKENEDGEAVRLFIVASKVDADAAAKILIPTQEVTAGKETSIIYQVVDSNGLDITSFIKAQVASGNGEFSFELANPDLDAYIANGKSDEPLVFVTVAGKTYTVKATYSWWSNNAGKMLTAPGSGTVVSIAEAVLKRDSSKFSAIISQSDKDYVKEDNTINGEVTALAPWAVNDGGVYLQAAIGYVNERTGKVTYESLDKAELEFDKYYVKSSNDNVVMVQSPQPYGKRVEIVANQSGSAWLIIYGQKAGKADVVVGTISVNVVDARKASKLTVTPSKKNINYAMGADDAIEFDVKLFDQYEKSGTLDGKVTVELFKGKDIDFVKKEHQSLGKIKVFADEFLAIPPKAIAANNVVLLKFTLEGTQISETVQINVGNEAEAQKQNLVVTADTLDTALKFNLKAEDIKTATIKLEGQTASGYAYYGENIKFVKEAPATRPAVSGEAVAAYVYTISRDGVLLKHENNDLNNFAETNNTLTNITKDTAVSPAATKLQKGTYVITAYKQEKKTTSDGIEKVIVTRLDSKQLVVTENKPSYSITTTDDAEKLVFALIDTNNEVKKAFKVKYDGKDITDGYFIDPATGFKVNGESKSAYVGKVQFLVGNDTVGYDLIELAVGPNNKGVVVRGL
jgi:hypothetical protein